MSEHYDLLPENNALNYLTDDNGDSYNRCHCKCQALLESDYEGDTDIGPDISTYLQSGQTLKLPILISSARMHT